MENFTYTPDRDTRVHQEGAIRLICMAFQSHESGLPEWLKNSSDAYAREDATEAKRVIVVLFNHGQRKASASISCLDLSGMTTDVIEESFRNWADPDASRRGAKNAAVQGGHGNGGKCYMTQMFDDYSVIQTVKGKEGNRYGVVSGSIKFGYVPDPATGRNYEVTDLKAHLEDSLRTIRCRISSLPQAAVDALALADGFSLITGVGPKGYKNRIPITQLVSNLQEHPQMIQTLEMCKVFIIVNGEPYNQGKPLTLPEIPPIEGAEDPRIVLIPDFLKDPITGEKVSTTDGGSSPNGSLILRTSDVSMRWKKKARHNVIYRARSGYIGYIGVSELDIQSPYRDQIYGECYLQTLEPFKQNERARLAVSPLTRAVERFISYQIQLYAKEFEAREQRKYDQEEKNAISRINEALDQWKNRFLNELMQGIWGEKEGDGGGSTSKTLPSGKPAKLELTLTHQRAGVGVAFRPTLKFFDNAGQRIRATPFKWVSDDTNVAMVDNELNIVNTFSFGQTRLYAETLRGHLRSNIVPLEVVQLREVRIEPREIQLGLGSRQKIDAICRLADGQETNSLYLVWTESDPNVARVSSSGLVFGFALGKTEVIAGDDKCMANDPAIVEVIPFTGEGSGGKRGRGYPIVLVSGEIDRDPQTEEYVNFSREDPPVTQRPQDADRNIWWINSAAPLARLYLDANRGYGYQSPAWRMYHLERYVDVIVQIALIHGPEEGQSLSADEWIVKRGYREAEIQAAAASDLREFISSGVLPGSEA